MVNFDISKEWVILLPPEPAAAKKCAEDLSRYIGLLAGTGGNKNAKPPDILDASGGMSEAVIILNNEGYGPERNGFEWRAGQERIEIFGESLRGLCNGVYSFLSALGINWPAPGQENLPAPAAASPARPLGPGWCFSLTNDSACEPSHFEGSEPAGAPWRRFIPDGMRAVKRILNKSEAFVAWAARRRYDAVVFPLSAFGSTTGRKLKGFKKIIAEYDIALEAGGRDLSSLVPRKFFFFHRDYFRMENGRRKKEHHFCTTNPGAIRLIEKEGGKMFRAAEGIKTFHLWPDKGAESTWCSCPSCRAFTPPEQNRIAVNTAADVLATLNPGASITYFEKAGEGGNIPLRKNLIRIERLPGEKEIR